MTQQMTSFLPNLSHPTKQLRELLKKEDEWQFLPEHREDFNTVKSLMSDANNLVAFSASRKTDY